MDSVNGVIHAVGTTTMTTMLEVVVVLKTVIQRPHPRLRSGKCLLRLLPRNTQLTQRSTQRHPFPIQRRRRIIPRRNPRATLERDQHSNEINGY
jgi:hypothetical protein